MLNLFVFWLSINDLCACVYIYIQQLSSFRAPTLWFIDLSLATCHIQHTFLRLAMLAQQKEQYKAAKVEKYIPQI